MQNVCMRRRSYFRFQLLPHDHACELVCHIIVIHVTQLEYHDEVSAALPCNCFNCAL